MQTAFLLLLHPSQEESLLVVNMEKARENIGGACQAPLAGRGEISKSEAFQARKASGHQHGTVTLSPQAVTLSPQALTCHWKVPA